MNIKLRRLAIVFLSFSFFLGLVGLTAAGFPVSGEKVLAEATGSNSKPAVTDSLEKKAAPKEENNPIDYAPLREKINQLTAGKQGVYGIYLKDLETGQVLNINGDRAFTAASTYKVPLNLFLYEKIIAGKVDPNSTIKYQPSDYEEGTGILQGEPYGKEFPIKYLSEISITVSDNIAKNMLERYLGGREEVLKYMAGLEAKTKSTEPYVNNLTSPHDLTIYMEEVMKMNAKYPEIAGKMMDDLMHTIYNDRINPLLPKDVKIAHKIGTQVNVLNDTGIIFHKKRPYILSIMTDKINYGEAYPTIQNISKAIYDFQDSL